QTMESGVRSLGSSRLPAPAMHVPVWPLGLTAPYGDLHPTLPLFHFHPAPSLPPSPPPPA
ncbi:unnamed protein product, partial [Coccothraustes coccothraustes]